MPERQREIVLRGAWRYDGSVDAYVIVYRFNYDPWEGSVEDIYDDPEPPRQIFDENGHTFTAGFLAIGTEQVVTGTGCFPTLAQAQAAAEQLVGTISWRPPE